MSCIRHVTKVLLENLRAIGDYRSCLRSPEASATLSEYAPEIVCGFWPGLEIRRRPAPASIVAWRTVAALARSRHSSSSRSWFALPDNMQSAPRAPHRQDRHRD